MKKIFILFLTVFIGLQNQAQTFTNYTTVDGLLADNVNALAVDGNDGLWFGTQSGVSHFDGTNWTGYTTDSGLVNNTIQAITVAGNGDIWAGTSFGASRYNGSSWTNFTTTDGLGSNQIKCITVGGNGTVWFGTNTGLTKYDGSAWTSWNTNDGLPFGGVVSITEGSNGIIWLGTGLGGVAVFNGTTFTLITEANGLVSNSVRSIAITGGAYKWVATAKGISVLDWSNKWVKNHTRPFTLPQPDTLNPVEDIKIDGLGRIWAGIYVDYLVTEGGVSMWDGYNWTQYEVSDGLVGPVIRKLAIDSQDNVWIATSTGVSKLSNVPIAVEEPIASTTLNVWPNPASDQVFINLTPEITQVEIYGIDMQLLQRESVSSVNGPKSISLAGLKSGIYFLKAGNQTAKILRN